MYSRIKKTISSKTFLLVSSVLFSAVLIFGTYIYKVGNVNAVCGVDGYRCFGGKIEKVEYCCNGLSIKVGDPSGGTFLLDIQSKLYMWWNPSEGQCVLGDAKPFAVCLVAINFPPCTKIKILDGTIRQMGTTLSGCSK